MPWLDEKACDADPGKPLLPGMGLYVHTLRRDGSRYYAVVSCRDGAENSVELTAENSVGPIDGPQATSGLSILN